MRIDVIDNGGQWTHKEWRVLKNLGIQSDIQPNTISPSALKDNDGLVLSGGAPSIVDELEKLGNISGMMDENPIPVLGICVGAQFIALKFGGKVGPGSVPEYGKTRVKFSDLRGVFSGIPAEITAWENHNDEIKELSDEFVLAGSSETCRIQAFYHKTKPYFGVQFHPEVRNTEFGEQIFKNFVEVCKK
ncbi:MAG: GMP synthase subunit A [Thermoplasmataceae archaeon]